MEISSRYKLWRKIKIKIKVKLFKTILKIWSIKIIIILVKNNNKIIIKYLFKKIRNKLIIKIMINY